MSVVLHFFISFNIPIMLFDTVRGQVIFTYWIRISNFIIGDLSYLWC